VVRALLEAGADMDAAIETEDLTLSVWYYAVGRPALLALLLEHFEVGGDEGRKAQLNRALALASEDDGPDRAECVRMLLAAGAELDVDDWPQPEEG
jgi:hypothetical protein